MSKSRWHLRLCLTAALLALAACSSRTHMVPTVSGTEFPGVPTYIAYLDGLAPTDPEDVRVSLASTASIEGWEEVWVPERVRVRPYAPFTPGRHFVHPDTLAALLNVETDTLVRFSRDSMHISGSPGGIARASEAGRRILHIGTFRNFIYPSAERSRLIREIEDGPVPTVSYGVPGELLLRDLEELVTKMRVRAASFGATRLVGLSFSMSQGRGLRMYAYAIAEDFGPPQGP